MTKVIKILKILNFKPWTLPANSLVPPKARKLSAGKVFHILGDSGASQSGREKRRDESLQARAEEPLGQANAGSWLGTKNALYYWSQSANSISWVLFMSLYPTAKLSHQTCPVRSPRLYVQGKFSFSTFLTKNEGITDEAEKRFRCFQQEHFSFPRNNSVSDRSQGIVNNREFKMPRRRRQRVRQKAIA